MTKAEPFFKEIFGSAWHTMPKVFHAHYANRAHFKDIVKVDGIMSVWQSPLVRPFSFLFRWTQTLIPICSDNLPAQVIFRTRPDRPDFSYDRTVVLKDGQRLNFVSSLEHKGGNQVVEWTGVGIGWHSTFTFEDNRVLLRHLGYRVRLKSIEFALPLTWIFGRPSAWEEALSDTAFKMEMTIRHPIFGTVYSYTGEFEIREISYGA